MIDPIAFARQFAAAQDAYDSKLPAYYNCNVNADDAYLQDPENIKRVASDIAAHCADCAENADYAVEINDNIDWPDLAACIQAVFQGAPDAEIGKLFQKAITNAMPDVIESQLITELEKKR